MKVHNIPSLNPLQLFRSPFQQQQQQPQSRAGLRPEQRGHIPKVPSLLFEIELEEAPVRPDIQDDSETQGILTNFRSLAVPWSKTEHELLAEWNSTHDTSLDNMQALDALASRLRSLGHPVSIRTALGGGWGGECLRNLRHSFIVCTVSGKEGSGVYIVDPAFKEQFDIAHATPRYQQILAAIPATFVGTEERLVALVRALCQEIQSVFLEQNATLPPWRDVAAQLSKWRPRHSMDRPFPQQQEAACSTGTPNHNLDLVRTASTSAAELVATRRDTHPQRKPGALARSSAPIPPVPSAQLGLRGADGSSKSAAGPGSRGNLYQRMATPVQQLVTRSYAQSGLLVSGL